MTYCKSYSINLDKEGHMTSTPSTKAQRSYIAIFLTFFADTLTVVISRYKAVIRSFLSSSGQLCQFSAHYIHNLKIGAVIMSSM